MEFKKKTFQKGGSSMCVGATERLRKMMSWKLVTTQAIVFLTI